MELLIPTVLWSINLGLMLGFTFGVLILLRPITRRLLRPKHHVILWFAGWIMGFTMSLYTTCGWLPLPLTFRGLLMPKGAIPGQPAFLALASDPGQAEVLSRGSLLPLPLSDRAAQILTIIWLVFFLALVAAWLLQDFRLRQIMQRGTVLPQESLSAYDLVPDTAVYLCPGLPTSFVRYGAAFSIADERHLICLQKELPPEQMRLVLLHECAHLRLHHAWFKAIMMMVVTLNFAWNPLIWAAYRLTCRDMELACDEAVMEQLSPHRPPELCPGPGGAGFRPLSVGRHGLLQRVRHGAAGQAAGKLAALDPRQQCPLPGTDRPAHPVFLLRRLTAVNCSRSGHVQSFRLISAVLHRIHTKRGAAFAAPLFVSKLSPRPGPRRSS